MGDEKQLVKGKGLSEGHLIKLPKKPVPAFFYFCIEKRKEYPNLGSVLEANHKLSQMWRDLAEDEKEVYMAAGLADKERYKKELSALTLKHPDSVKTLLAGKRGGRRKKGETLPPKKRGRKRKIILSSPPSLSSSSRQSPPPSLPPPSPPPPLSPPPPPPSPPPPSPPPPEPPTSTSTTSKRAQQTIVPQIKVPGTDISIFTPEFMEHNKKLNSQLTQLRKVNKDLQLENSRLEDSISDQERNLVMLQKKLSEFRQENEHLQRSLQQLEGSILSSFGSLVKDSDITSAEELLQCLITNGVNGRALAAAVKSFNVP